MTDPSGATIAGATVEIQNKVTGYDKTTTTRRRRSVQVSRCAAEQLPHWMVKAPGFQDHIEDIDVRTTVAVNLTDDDGSGFVHDQRRSALRHRSRRIGSDRACGRRLLPVRKAADEFCRFGPELRSIAHSAPGIIEDSNGFIHPQGDHAQTQFVFDNQPITDQQSKQFSTSMPENAIASVEVITGAPPAEYGDKTSLVINAITKSGLGVDKSFGSFSTSYGSFGTASESVTFGEGGKKWGEFISVNGVRSGRYLDPPEFSALHDVGNNETIFNRFDYQPDQNDSLHLNLFFARAWFQTPNTYDQQIAGQDQRELI